MTNGKTVHFSKRINLTKYPLQLISQEGTPGQVYEMVILLPKRQEDGQVVTYSAKLYVTAETVRKSGYFSEA